MSRKKTLKFITNITQDSKFNIQTLTYKKNFERVTKDIRPLYKMNLKFIPEM